MHVSTSGRLKWGEAVGEPPIIPSAF